MDNRLARVLFEQGAKKRNPSLFKHYHALKESEWLSRDALETIQMSNLHKFLDFAGKQSPYYRELFKRYGFKTGSLSSPEDIQLIPETSKDTLISQNKAVHCENFREKTRIAETSGTSGAALSFARSEGWDSLNRATMMRAYDWYGVKPWDRNGYLWGYNISPKESLKIKLLDGLQNRFRLFDYSLEEIRKFAKKLSSASFLNGYSSMVYETAKIINEHDLERPKLKLVKGTSEMILDVYHPETQKAFGCKVTSEYGAAESGLIAFECPDGRMHVNIENLLLETNDKGEALITNFASDSFPIIRYNLGDAVTIDDTPCSCGRAHPTIKDISGRKGAKVIGKQKTYPALTFYYVFKNLALQSDLLMNYKAVQSEPGKVTLYIEDRANSKHEHAVKAQLKQYFGGDVDFKIEYPDRFNAERKKRQYFESLVQS